MALSKVSYMWIEPSVLEGPCSCSPVWLVMINL